MIKEKYLVIVTLVGAFLVISGMMMGLSMWILNCENGCAITSYQLVEQHIGSIDPSLTEGIKSCDKCLIFTVKSEKGVTQTLFFANEYQLRNDFEAGDYINVNWCNINGNYLIRGVWKQ